MRRFATAAQTDCPGGGTMKGLAGRITYETDIILPPACLFFERVPYLCNFRE